MVHGYEGTAGEEEEAKTPDHTAPEGLEQTTQHPGTEDNVSTGQGTSKREEVEGLGEMEGCLVVLLVAKDD